jgi:hypothetical protein
VLAPDDAAVAYIGRSGWNTLGPAAIPTTTFEAIEPPTTP